MMHEVVIATVPEREQDFILSCLHFRENMPPTQRKYLLGPIVATGGDRCFIFLPCSCQKVDELRTKFLDHAKSNSMVKFCHVKFGEGFSLTSSSDQLNLTDKEFLISQIKKMEAEYADSLTCLKEEIKDLIDRNDKVEKAFQLAKLERDDAIMFLNRDTVLSSAVSELKKLKGKRQFIEAAEKVAQDFKDKEDVPDSVKNLLSLQGNESKD